MLHHVVLEIVPHDPPAPSRATLAALPPGVALDRHLAQWFVATPGRVEAHYVFDDDYARAHPEALDARHLALVHGILLAKLLDDGEVISTRAQLASSLRWPAIDRRARPLA